MQNDNLDDTQPHKITAGEPPPDPGATKPVPIAADETETDLGQTVPTRTGPDVNEHPGFDEPASHAGETSAPPPVPPSGNGKPDAWRRLRRFWPLLGLLLLLLIAVASALLGYSSGISKRKQAEATQVALRLEEQFQLGLQDLEARRYDRARQRFEYVIQLDPGYPGVTEKLAEALLFMNATATPTIVPTPTISPTPDNRTVEERFVQSQQYLANQDWTAAIDTLLSLRKEDPNYQPVWVDDMLYISFRNRGVDKILRSGNLEEGIYDLTVAEQFGPLDADGKSYLTWARLYITGASFWELDWGQAVFYFAQVAPALPNLRDGSGWTATERYRLALIGYAKQLTDEKQWCDAVEQFELALSIGPDAEAEAALQEAHERCDGRGDGEEAPPTQETPIVTPLPTTGETLQPSPTPPVATPTPTNPAPTATPEPPTSTPEAQEPSPTSQS